MAITALAETDSLAHRLERDVRQGRLQQTMAIMTAFAAVLGGGEAFSQHRRGAFDHWLMWTPVWLSPPMVLASACAVLSGTLARLLLPITSLTVILDGIVGFVVHIQGVRRMPGGFHAGSYNIVMGPPLFAPLLLCTIGVLGLLTAAMRRQ